MYGRLVSYAIRTVSEFEFQFRFQKTLTRGRGKNFRDPERRIFSSPLAFTRTPQL